MDYWQQQMQAGNKALAAHQPAQAEYCYRQALKDVWPVWFHSCFIESPAELAQEQACLPTFCLAATIRNLAESYARQKRWRRSQRTLRQALHWFELGAAQMAAEHPAALAVLTQVAQFRQDYQQLKWRQHYSQQSVWIQPEPSGLLH
ncbi:hypothetical protein [Rheinheimera sp.]|uniref:hypothetical protein n=1 Tax=Rheinheimera sp. TaxID=1869214 RepID=UPI00307EDE46